MQLNETWAPEDARDMAFSEIKAISSMDLVRPLKVSVTICKGGQGLIKLSEYLLNLVTHVIDAERQISIAGVNTAHNLVDHIGLEHVRDALDSVASLDCISTELHVAVVDHLRRGQCKVIGRFNKSNDASWQGIGSSLVASEQLDQAVSQDRAAGGHSAAQQVHQSGEHSEGIDSDTERVLGGHGAHVRGRVQIS